MAVGDIKIFIHRFWTVFKPDPKDGSKMIGIDMIEFSPLTQVDRSKLGCTVSSLRPVDASSDTGNPAIQMANDLWDRIQPAYQAFKRGQELPDDGTPLAAWNGVSAEQATVFRTKGLRTVESIADMGDGMMERIGLPGMRDIVRAAKGWLDARDQNRAAVKIQQDERERAAMQVTISEQAAQLTEMQEMIAELMSKKPAKAPPPSKRKPPPRPAPAPVEEEVAA
jgi:hypothetical protein